MIITAFCDGGFNSTKDSYYGSYKIFVTGNSDINVIQKTFLLPNVRTSNEAEYLAVLVTVINIYKKFNGIKSIYIHSDSRLVVLQVNGIWNAVKYKHIRDKIFKFRNGFSDFNLSWIPGKIMKKVLGH